MTRVSLVTLGLALGGCGNYSTEDLRFLAALPTRDDLHVGIPSGGTSGALTVCGPLGSADVWLRAKPTSDGLNRGVEFVISLVDVVRKYPPSYREENLRRWGPFADEKHPGHEIEVVLERTYPDGPDGPPVHEYEFEARQVGAPTFDPLIVGTFAGASSSRGHGTVDLYFENFWSVGVNDDSTPHGTMLIAYDRASDPVTIDLGLTNEGFGVVRFDYAFTGYGAGQGGFTYAFRNASGDLLEVTTGYDATSAGRASVAFTPAGWSTPAGSFRQCWDQSACLTYVDDPGNFTCDTSCSGCPTSCSGGVVADCPNVPVPVF